MSEPTQVQESGDAEGTASLIKQEVLPTLDTAADSKPVEIKKEIEDVPENVNVELGNSNADAISAAVETPQQNVAASNNNVEPVNTEAKIKKEIEDTPENVNEKVNAGLGNVETIPTVVEPPMQNVATVTVNNDWEAREQELLNRIAELEKGNTEGGDGGLQASAIQLQLKVREDEIDLLRARVKNLEMELQAALSNPNAKNKEIVEKIKEQHEELLSKARGMIFDKTKIVKNQELQIEALTTQIQSLKDINQITKDLLEIRNSEVKAMEDRLAAMEARFKAEKQKHSLVLERAQTSSTLNDDLRKEYETQLAIFKELREKYEQRVQALVSENKQLKELRGGGGSGGGSSG